MARKREEPEANADGASEDSIQLTKPVLDAIAKEAAPPGTRLATSKKLKLSPATITNLLNGHQRTLRRDKYDYVCKVLRLDAGSQIEQMVTLAGGMTEEELAPFVAIMKSRVSKR